MILSRATWQDKEKRRAALLSLTTHLLLFLLIFWLYRAPQQVEQETFIVIDVGTPAFSEDVTHAPTVDDPAPQSPVPEVEDERTGEPQQAQVETETPQETETAAEAETTPVPEAPPEAEAEAPEQVTPPPPEARVPSESTPVSVPEVPVSEAPLSTALPEINEVQLEPRPLTETVTLPTPTVTADVPPARAISATPSVSIAEARAVPEPQPETSVSEGQVVPTPEAQASVAEPQPVPQPEAEVSVAESRSLAVTPQVNVSAARPVPNPNITTSVTQPEVSVEAEPEATLTEEADVVEEEEEASTAGGAEEDALSVAQSQRESEQASGGSADRSGQTSEDEDATAEGLGAAASPDGSDDPTGAPLTRVVEPYRARRDRPLTVIIDNLHGYPQAGLLEASAIYELPVEGGVSRLMTVYDQRDPQRVGPIRSARDYFHAASENMNGVLVHDGGAPSALASISQSNTPTLNSYSRGELFSRDTGRSAPYNLYSSGNSLRQAINTLNLAQGRDLRGRVFRPGEGAGDAERVSVRYSGNYTTGFRFLPEVNRYRWVRNGQDASDAFGEGVFVDAVVVAQITAQTIPGDPYGRLYIPLRGGEATLYLRGKEIPGTWSEQRGLTFVSAEGEQIDLEPFKHWVVFAPTWATVSNQ